MKVKFNSFRESIVATLKKKPVSTAKSWAEVCKKKNKQIKYRKINGTRMVVGAFRK